MSRIGAVVFALVSLSALLLAAITQHGLAQYSGAVTIKADGTVEPSNAPILKNENVYTLTRNFTGTISIYRDNAVFNGAGYTIQNPRGTTGVRIFSHGAAVINLTIIKTSGSTTDADIGIDLHGNHALIANNTIIGNQRIKTASIYAESTIHIYVGSNNTIVGNTIKDNKEGLYFIAVMAQGNASNNLIYGNNFINNTQNVVNTALLASTPVNTWNNASFGNYWSDYNGADLDGDGIGDTPYVINAENQDNYPLMAPVDFSNINLKLPDLPGAPTITVLSPENKTYSNANITLNFVVNKPTEWVGYCLDEQDNVTVTGNATISGLSNGVHTLTVYANDTFGVTGASETVTFTITKPETFTASQLTAAAIIASAAAICLGLLAYFTKPKEKENSAIKRPHAQNCQG